MRGKESSRTGGAGIKAGLLTWGFCLSLLLSLALAACEGAAPGASGTAPANPPVVTQAPPEATSAAPTSTGAPASTPAATVMSTSPASTVTPPATLSAPATITTGSVVTGTPSAPQGWQTYRNPQAGYIVSYPPGWTVQQGAQENATSVTIFTPPSKGPGISVAVRTGEVDKEPIDLPNQRCSLVRVGGLSGWRCFDAISLSTVSTLAGGGKTFIITSTGKGLDQNVYQQFIESLKLIQ